MQGLWNQSLIWGWTLFWQEKSGSSSQTCVSCFSGFQSMLIFRPNFPFPSKAHQCPTTGTGESWPNETLLGPYPVPAYASPDSRRSRIKPTALWSSSWILFCGGSLPTLLELWNPMDSQINGPEEHPAALAKITDGACVAWVPVSHWRSSRLQLWSCSGPQGGCRYLIII